MKKRLVAMLLVSALAVSMLAGCGGGKDKGGSTTDISEFTVDEKGRVNGLMYETGLPLVDEGAASFSMFSDNSSETGEFYMMDEFKKQTNVDVELRLYPNETAKERLNLDLNSGDYADVIGGWTLTDSHILTYGVNQGIFIPLEDYFEKYCPNITAVLDRPGVRERMTAPDGHIYGIPYVCDDNTVSYSPYINSKWLENVGMEMPTTTEEFEAVLKAFKEKDANGNGDPNDEIPFSTDPNNKSIESMTGYFGLPMNKFGEAIKDGKLVYGGVSSEYRELLSWFSSLFDQGLVDSEIFTQDSSTWEGKGARDLYGCAIAFGSSEFSGIAATTEKSVFDAMPVLNTDKGGIWLRATPGYNVYRTQAVITNNAKNPELICRWFDNAFELENGIQCTKGVLDVNVFKEGDQYRFIDASLTDLSEEEKEKISWGNLWLQELPKYMPPKFKFLEDNPLYDEKKATEAVYEPNLTKETREPFWIPLDSIDKFSDSETAIIDYFNQQQAMFIFGEMDVDDDAQWEAYVEGMKALGLEDWLEIRGVESIVE